MRRFNWALALGFWLCALLGAATLSADAGETAGAGSAEPPSAAPPPLAPLPEVPKQDLPAPTPEQLAQLKDLLDRITGDEPVARERGVREILEADPRWVAAISHSLDRLAESTKSEELRRKLTDLRDKARNAERERMRAESKRGKVETPDYMKILADFPEPKSEQWRAVTQIVAMSRMLSAIGTTDAVRTLIRIYVRFGEFLRVDVQLQLEKLGDKALPALIEARRHQAPKISRWAERQLDALGKAIPSEAVQAPDPDVLADVLRAYGYTRDPDAARVVISFANSERPQVREAARQSVAMMKEVANWPLRDTYANIVGKKPPGDWAWDRTARELFGEFDRLRLAQVYKLFNQGKTAQQAGKVTEAKQAFDKVLARSPLFDRRAEMIDTYVAYADSVLDTDPEAAEAALRRARRLSQDDAVDKRVQSLLWWIEGQDLVQRGVADQVPFRRALELDPSNERAKKSLAEIQRGEKKREEKLDRYFAALAIGAVALLAIAVIGLRRGQPVGAVAPAAPAPTGSEGDSVEPQASPFPPAQPMAETGGVEAGDGHQASPLPPAQSNTTETGGDATEPSVSSPRPSAVAASEHPSAEAAAEAPIRAQEARTETAPEAASAVVGPPAAERLPASPASAPADSAIPGVERPEAIAADTSAAVERPEAIAADTSAAVECPEAAPQPFPHETPALPPIKPLELPPLPGASLKLPPLPEDES